MVKKFQSKLINLQFNIILTFFVYEWNHDITCLNFKVKKRRGDFYVINERFFIKYIIKKNKNPQNLTKSICNSKTSINSMRQYLATINKKLRAFVQTFLAIGGYYSITTQIVKIILITHPVLLCQCSS
ncbi:Schizosaccharomyces pombe specific protein [Schizosaccharomyces pombe]|uniref:Uncharacterized protein PB21E7.05 n=1 Tax=Schizosaccharomyces pombe (strain 972 / ATCC 24843) TaxID=284812 RepID=YP35_SCHPO|nr:uncharacterized protein SPBPB21E7.05 [Schizosaccharomyces pombe]Q8NIL4.1 RecName: Full=Uncharacterized protein PB21E7.05 [Schizosaccharomyces pombe 972h-]CAD31745.1 sequence orphan [Schizosaccharomyces pombe]|eukprot:NP_001018771.1 uncharacterized protein SPBPB21E7.05 [Schizosaccharomyces pombe]